MVDDYRTEEEQIEAIKNWWDENGQSTLLAVALALAGVFGWQYWQSSQTEAREGASAQYESLLASIPQEGEQTASQFATTQHLAEELKTNYSSLNYAYFAAFQLAKLYVERDELSAAREQLQWVVDQKPSEPAIAALARLRLARVVYAEEGAEQALSLIDNVESGPYTAEYAELRGDLYADLGQLEQAEQNYSLAIDSAAAAQQQPDRLLQLKHKGVQRRLAMGAAAPEPAVEAAAVAAQTEAQAQTDDSEPTAADSDENDEEK